MSNKDRASSSLGHSFVLALFENRNIESNIFSIHLSSKDVIGGRYVDFGLPVESSMSNPKDLKWIELIEDEYWKSNVQGLAFGSLSNSFIVPTKVETVKTYFDSILAFITLPDEIYYEYISYLVSYATGEEVKIVKNFYSQDFSAGIT